MYEPQNYLVVNTLQDEVDNDGNCSLRESIEAANTNTNVADCGTGDVLTDTITFGVAGTILVNSQLEVNGGGPLEINGSGTITISGGDVVQIFYAEADADLLLESLTLMHGYMYEDDGGGIYNFGTLTITDSTLNGNSTRFFGGGIVNRGTLTITNSTISGNTAWNGGGIAYWGKLEIKNSNLSGNSALRGGGISNVDGLILVNHNE